MNIIDFYCLEHKRLHNAIRRAVSDLTPDEWHHKLEGTGNNIAFLVWHCVRTEDGIHRFILQGRTPIWNEGKWHERLNLPPRIQGTGMPMEEAQALTVSDPALFMHYAEQVWQEFEAYLAGITDGGAELSERIVMVKPLGNMSAILAIGQVCLTHCFTHLGEIALLRGSIGKQGMSF